MMDNFTTHDLQRLAHELMQLDAVKADHSETDVLHWLDGHMQCAQSGGAASSSSGKVSSIVWALMRLAHEQLKNRDFANSVDQRPQSLECDVWRFQNKKEKWVAFVGLLDGRPYEIFTGLQDDEEGIVLPKSVNNGWIVKNLNSDGSSRYDFCFQNRRGYKTTVEGLSARFNKEYWNYAKLISGVLRHGMPVAQVIRLIESLQLESDAINTWKIGVARALKKYATTAGETDDWGENNA